MRIVVFSDIHGNVVALEAVLADIRAKGWPDALFIAGDLVLSGPRPAEALALLRSIPGARFVQGNCDEYVANLHDLAADVVFTRERMTADDLAFLGNLPLTDQIEVAPGHSLLVCHANPQNLEDPIKPDLHESIIRPLLHGVSAELIAFGHYHVPFVRELPPYTLVDISSVGIPLDGDQRSVYAVLTWEKGRWQIEHHRVTYDWDAVARDFATVDFPNAEWAISRLLNAKYAW
jgi:predicted phosphodiesterase